MIFHVDGNLHAGGNKDEKGVVSYWGIKHKTAYCWLIHEPISQSTNIETWSWVWKLPLPENIKHFIWLCLHESLTTNSVCFHRHMCFDLSCCMCGATEQTILHTLRDCPISRRVWTAIQYIQNQDFDLPNCNNWLRSQLCTAHASLFAVSCWIIWKARNHEVFNDQRWSEWQLINQIITLMKTINTCFPSSQNATIEKQVRWHTPREQQIKINVDHRLFWFMWFYYKSK